MNRIDFPKNNGLPRLILVTNRRLLSNESLNKFIERCCKYGIKAIQIREKDISSNELLSIAKKLRKVTAGYGAKLLINDRMDIALLSKADGIHSRENGTPAKYIKRNSKKFLAGKSVHSLNSAKEAEKDDYDYIICGPVFKTPSKVKYGKPLGLKLLNEICFSVHIPVFAIGGINPLRAKKCIERGAYGVGVIGEIFNSKNLQETFFEFGNSLGGL